MVVDTSAVAAYVFGEPEAIHIEDCLADAKTCLMSAFTALECRMVLCGRLGDAGIGAFDRFARLVDLDIVPFDASQVDVAFDAFLRYGRGTGHPARLNMGDCAAYALAVARGLPLLFVGQDFRHTDVTPAL